MSFVRPVQGTLSTLLRIFFGALPCLSSQGINDNHTKTGLPIEATLS